MDMEQHAACEHLDVTHTHAHAHTHTSRYHLTEAQPEEDQTERTELWQYQKLVKGKRLWITFADERSKILTEVCMHL